MFRGTLNSLNLFEADLGFALPALLVGILVVVAVAATVVPARRASGVAPLSALTE
jgi:ABC-type lipoprotein release transport system permease subunit